MYYNKWINNDEKSNVQSHNQEKSKMNSTLIANSRAYTLIDHKIIKIPFDNNNKETIKNKYNSKQNVITRVYELGSMMSM